MEKCCSEKRHSSFVNIYIAIISVDDLIEEYLDYPEDQKVTSLDAWGHLFGCVTAKVNV